MNRKPFFLSKTFIPDAAQNKMSQVDDVAASRADFIRNRPGNLNYLLEKRYSWMNDYIGDQDRGIEVGAGNGVSRLFITKGSYEVTDYADFEWLDRKVDALNMPYEDGSLDFIISSNMIHHLAHPYQFLDECYRVLKPGGKLLIQEIHGSFFLRLILKLMKHEGYNFNVDPFDKSCVCNDPENLWSGNNVLPNLLFDDARKFEESFHFRIVEQHFSEFFIFPLSGGVTAKTKTIQLPRALLNFFNAIDNLLVSISKDTFALQRRIVLEKQ
jgi:SAM-dependent methyltransferase